MLRTSIRCAFFVYLLAIFLIGTPYSLAQSRNTSLRGAVVDKSGGAIVGAKVKLVNKDNAVEREMETKENGEYHLALLPPGSYSLDRRKSGF